MEPITKVRIRVTAEDRFLLSLLKRVVAPSDKASVPSPLPSFQECLQMGSWSGLTPWIINAWQEVVGPSKEVSLLGELASVLLQQQSLWWKHAASELSRTGVEILTFKGLLFAHTIYSSAEMPLLNDIDILLRPQDIQRAKLALETVGFSQNFISNNGSLEVVGEEAIRSFESPHYELFPFTKITVASEDPRHARFVREYGLGHPFFVEGDVVLVAIELDVHHNLSVGIDLEDVWADPLSVVIDGSEAMTLSPSTQYWFTAARFYHEVMYKDSRKLRPILDLAKLTGYFNVQWGEVIRVSDKYKLAPALYYVSRFLQDCCNVRLPAHFLQTLGQQLESQPTYHDAGDFLPKVLRRRLIFRI